MQSHHFHRLVVLYPWKCNNMVKSSMNTRDLFVTFVFFFVLLLLLLFLLLFCHGKCVLFFVSHLFSVQFPVRVFVFPWDQFHIFIGGWGFSCHFSLTRPTENVYHPLYYRVEWCTRVGLTICILHILKEAKHKFIHSGKLESR